MGMKRYGGKEEEEIIKSWEVTGVINFSVKDVAWALQEITLFVLFH